MGVYLSNIEMPRTHPITVEVYPDGTVISKTVGRRDIHGTAVPVHPHGDLIDRKTTYNSLLDGMVMTGYQSMALDCIRECYVPTVIPAEEKE